MNLSTTGESETTTASPRSARAPFSEGPAWEPIGDGWHPLHGSFRDLGYSIEWHDFTTERELDWSRSFHPGGVEICLNLAGHGTVEAGRRQIEFAPSTAGFYLRNAGRLAGSRAGRERHQFITVEFSFDFLGRNLDAAESGLHPLLRKLLDYRGRVSAAVSEPARLTSEQEQVIPSLRSPPVHLGGRRMWSQAKALEVAATLFYQPSPGEELFCHRQKRLSGERALKVVALLKENLEAPLSLDEIGRRVGCSPFHLSRTFTQEMGKTISVYLRGLRMERAAALLREGKMNVTEAALAVGYSSLSHFSSAFHETFGCCPGLYPLRTLPQRMAKPDRG